MGRYILIETSEDPTPQRAQEMLDDWGQEYQVIGLFVRPDDSCVCQPTIINGETQPPTIRVSQVGWWVCLECMKPRPEMGWLANQISAEEIKNPYTALTGLPNQPRVRVMFYANHIALMPRRV